MTSRLENLVRPLQWSDFGTPRQMNEPGPNQVAPAAFTDARYDGPSWQLDPVPGHRPAVYRLHDDMVVTISLRSTSWVATWTLNRPAAEQERLLKHEQGHYDVVALMARDCFVEFMQLKELTFRRTTEATEQIAAIQARYGAGAIDGIMRKYDGQTSHSLNQATQRTWDGYFQRAFTEARNPASQSPDGIPHKVRLLDVLAAAGAYP